MNARPAATGTTACTCLENCLQIISQWQISKTGNLAGRPNTNLIKNAAAGSTGSLTFKYLTSQNPECCGIEPSFATGVGRFWSKQNRFGRVQSFAQASGGPGKLCGSAHFRTPTRAALRQSATDSSSSVELGRTPVANGSHEDSSNPLSQHCAVVTVTLREILSELRSDGAHHEIDVNRNADTRQF